MIRLNLLETFAQSYPVTFSNSASLPELDCRIIMEDIEQEQRESMLEAYFGTSVQPTLEKVHYKVFSNFSNQCNSVFVCLFVYLFEDAQMQLVDHCLLQLETRFKGNQLVPAMSRKDDLFKCQVRLEGPNVMEGIRELAEVGIAETPMPRHMRNLPSLGRNTVLLRDKRPRHEQSVCTSANETH